MPYANTLTKAISLTVRCNDCLYEWRMEEQRSQPFQQTIGTNGENSKFNFNVSKSKPENMQRDTIQYKLQKQIEKHCRHAKDWCLYYKESKEPNVGSCSKKQCQSYYAKNALLKVVLKNHLLSHNTDCTIGQWPSTSQRRSYNIFSTLWMLYYPCHFTCT